MTDAGQRRCYPDEKSLMAEDCILETTGLVKEFRGFVAVNEVTRRRNDVPALVS